MTLVKFKKTINIKMKFPIWLILTLFTTSEVSGHGRLVDPPSRSTMWRYGFKNPPNYNDNQLYCGGVQVQYEQSLGKCGVCGDPWQGPRDNEEGGKYSNGIIVRTYDPGEVISVTVELTASHKGYFEFKICPKNNPREKTTQRCLDNYPLQLEDGSGTKFNIPNKTGYQLLVVKLRLPDDVRCRDCTFQWKYNAGNSWGSSTDGGGCLGCGNQEQFYACADIAIGYDDIDEGDSLLDGENYKKENYEPPPPPPVIAENPEDHFSNVGTLNQWSEPDHGSSSFWDALVGNSNHAQDTESVVEGLKKLKQAFKNRYIRPCICHSCVGNTCVCECLPQSHGQSYITDGANSWLLYFLGTLSCLLPMILL